MRCQKLWEYLVPPSGCAKTAQGEVIRIVVKVSNEILGNGGANWDNDFKKMLDTLFLYFKMGNPLPQGDFEEAARLIRKIYRGSGFDEFGKLSEYAVAWVLLNQPALALIPPTYKR